MNGSLYTADRATHRRIVLTASIAAVLFTLAGLGARVPVSDGMSFVPQPLTKSMPSSEPPRLQQRD